MTISNKSGKIAKAHEDLADSVPIPKKVQEDDLYKNKNCVYLQPAKAISAQRKKNYKPPTIKFEIESTYTKSYPANNVSLRKKIVKKCKNFDVTGKIDYNTTNQMSYTGHYEKRVKEIFPRTHLKCGGSANFSSTYSESFFNPGIVKTLSIKPIREKVQDPVMIDCATTMNESFQDPGVQSRTMAIKPKCKVFVTDAKIESLTVNRASYNKNGLQKRTSFRPKRPQVLVSSKMEGDSVYKSSYKPPGCCLKN